MKSLNFISSSPLVLWLRRTSVVPFSASCFVSGTLKDTIPEHDEEFRV